LNYTSRIATPIASNHHVLLRHALWITNRFRLLLTLLIRRPNRLDHHALHLIGVDQRLQKNAKLHRAQLQ
jgi:hypothetical protein